MLDEIDDARKKLIESLKDRIEDQSKHDSWEFYFKQYKQILYQNLTLKKLGNKNFKTLLELKDKPLELNLAISEHLIFLGLDSISIENRVITLESLSEQLSFSDHDLSILTRACPQLML